MKKLTFLIIFLIAGLLIGQSKQKWVTFSYRDYINVVSASNDNIWVGTGGGIVKINKSTGEYTAYDKINSPLPSDNIYAIYINPSTGTKYFGTSYGGVIKLEGEQWTVIPMDSIIGVDYVSSITMGPQGKLWVGMNNGGLGVYDGTKWKFYDNWNSELPSKTILDIFTDHNGVIWVSTAAGLVKISGSTWQVFSPANSNFPSYFIYDIAEDSRNNLWFATPDKGLIKFDGTNYKIYDSSNSPLISPPLAGGGTCKIYKVAVTPSDGIWVGTSNYLFYYDGTNWTHYDNTNSTIPNIYIYGLYYDSDNTLWVGTPRGLVKYKNEKWSAVQTSDAPFKDQITTIVPAKNKTVWIGTDGDGIYRLHELQWEHFDLSNFGFRNRISKLYLDPTGVLWAGTMQDGVAYYENNDWHKMDDTNNYLTPYDINDIVYDSHRHKIWFARASNGLVSYDLNNGEWQQIMSSDSTFPDNDIHCLYYDDYDYSLWVGTHHGLARLTRDENWVVYDPTNSGLPGYGVKQMVKDRSGVLWALVPSYWNGDNWDEGGLAKWNGTDNWTAISREASGLVQKGLMSLDVDNNNELVIGTDSEGLVIFSGENDYRTYTTANSPLPMNKVAPVAVDSAGNIWMASASNFHEQIFLTAFNENGVVLEVKNDKNLIAKGYKLFQNYPNPFPANGGTCNPTTTIKYSIPVVGTAHELSVRLTVYDILGREVETLVNKHQTPGNYTLRFNASGLPSGVYFYRLKAGNFSEVKKMILMK